MCGIAGIISGDPSRVHKNVLQGMADSLAHRGPNGEACWISVSGHAGLSHRWLAVIDRHTSAAQPMHYLERYTIVYNGEIYNYIELRSKLLKAGYTFRTMSDTEVLLAAYDMHKQHCVDHFDGMFAFAIWDEQEKILFCARDRFGEKPFYYLHNKQQGAFYFGSEMKALYAAGITRGVNHRLLLRFLLNGYTSNSTDPSQTFDGNIQKLPAAHCCIFKVKENSVDTFPYWSVDKNYRISISEDKAVARFTELLTESVRIRLRSDVSIGTSLSGGLDSSSIASIISGVQPGKYKTFTAAFPGFEKDESMHARDIADGYGFQNYTIAPSADELLRDLGRLMHHQEEPFTSASVYAQYRVFGLAKENNVTVLLDGQGADETLAGYRHYRRWPLRALFPGLTYAIVKRRENNAAFNNTGIDPGYMHAWKTPAFKPMVRSLNDMLFFDTFQSGLEDLLRYADRNSMAHGREVRLPFLSHELVTFLFSLPDDFKVHKGWTKWILRTAMNNELPQHICWQKRKVGFEPPQKTWMQNKEFIAHIRQAQSKLVGLGILRREVLDKKVEGHDAYDRGSESWRQLVSYLYLTL